MEKKLRIDGLKPDCRLGSRWMRAFIEDCYDILARSPQKTTDRQYVKEFSRRVADSASDAHGDNQSDEG